MNQPDPPWPPPDPQGYADGGRDRPFAVPFSILEAFGLVVWSIVAQVLVLVGLALAGVDLQRAGGATLGAVILVIQAVTLAGVLAWLAGRGTLSWRLLGPTRPRPHHAAVGLGVGLSGFVIVISLMAAIRSLLGDVEPPEQQLLDVFTRGGIAALLSIVAAVVMAPVVEETIYRGVLFQALRRRAGLGWALVISGAVFAVVHQELTHPLYQTGLFVLGVWFAWAFHRTGSLLVPITAHMAFNGCVVVLVALGAA